MSMVISCGVTARTQLTFFIARGIKHVLSACHINTRCRHKLKSSRLTGRSRKSCTPAVQKRGWSRRLCTFCSKTWSSMNTEKKDNVTPCPAEIDADYQKRCRSSFQKEGEGGSRQDGSRGREELDCRGRTSAWRPHHPVHRQGCRSPEEGGSPSRAGPPRARH